MLFDRNLPTHCHKTSLRAFISWIAGMALRPLKINYLFLSQKIFPFVLASEEKKHKEKNSTIYQKYHLIYLKNSTTVNLKSCRIRFLVKYKWSFVNKCPELQMRFSQLLLDGFSIRKKVCSQ